MHATFLERDRGWGGSSPADDTGFWGVFGGSTPPSLEGLGDEVENPPLAHVSVPKMRFPEISGANPWLGSCHHTHGRLPGKNWDLLLLQAPGEPHLNQKKTPRRGEEPRTGLDVTPSVPALLCQPCFPLGPGSELQELLPSRSS